MIDYHLHALVLDACRPAAVPSGRGPAFDQLKADLTAAAAAAPGAALAGAVIDHVVTMATSDGRELDRLERASELWKQGLAIYDTIGQARSGIETALADPAAPGAVAAMNGAVGMLAALQGPARALQDAVKALSDEVWSLDHVRPHPRQKDVPVTDWAGGDVFLARRTHAFAGFLLSAASERKGRALAFGVLSSYAGNAVGSAYLSQAVGGPRRSHRFRDRLARNSVGAWTMRQPGRPSWPALADALTLTQTDRGPGFPRTLRRLLDKAWREAYRTKAPDFDLGLRRVVRHMELLDSFRMPPEPPPISAALASTMSAQSPADTGVNPMTADPLGNGGPAPGSGGIDPGSDVAPKKTEGNCLVLALLALVFLITLLVYCVVKWIDVGKCDPSDWWDEIAGGGEAEVGVGVSGDFLTVSPGTPQAAHVIVELQVQHAALWQAFDAARAALAQTGLVYPTADQLELPLFAQFLTLRPRFGWPHREDPAAHDRFHRYPDTPTEAPAALPHGFGPGATPASILQGLPQLMHAHSAPAAFDAVLAAFVAGADPVNLDLDADRAAGFPCWMPSPGTSIEDDPVSALPLTYAEV